MKLTLKHGQMLEDAEFGIILHVLRLNEGHRDNTARALGMSLRNLTTKLQYLRAKGYGGAELRSVWKQRPVLPDSVELEVR